LGGLQETFDMESRLCCLEAGPILTAPFLFELIALIDPDDPHERTFLGELRGGTRCPIFLGQRNNMTRDQLPLDAI
jgi:hypothetical protein